jgi:ribonuclease HI
MLISSLPYIGFADGTSRSTQNLASASWAIYGLMDELVSLHGVFLGRETNNITEYSAVIESLTNVVSPRIHHLIVCVNSYLVVL